MQDIYDFSGLSYANRYDWLSVCEGWAQLSCSSKTLTKLNTNNAIPTATTRSPPPHLSIPLHFFIRQAENNKKFIKNKQEILHSVFLKSEYLHYLLTGDWEIHGRESFAEHPDAVSEFDLADVGIWSWERLPAGGPFVLGKLPQLVVHETKVYASHHDWTMDLAQVIHICSILRNFLASTICLIWLIKFIN